MPDKVEKRETSCFTYEVVMVVQVFAENKEAADDLLEQNGGYISYRSVTFKDKIGVYSGEEASEEEADKKVEE
jgi:hypothetical protein